MQEHRLKFKEKISRRSAHEMILLFAKYGNHYHLVHFRTDADVKRFFAANGLNYEALVQKCRNFSQGVPIFENKFGSTWTAASGLEVSRVDFTGREDLNVSGPAKFTLASYWAAFETAVEARNRSVSNGSYTELQSAIVNGIASIEGYINYRAEQWNKVRASEALVDSRESKVSLDDRIDEWIPKMTSKKLDKGGTEWAHFKILRSIRDNVTVHPKASGYSITLAELAEKVNLFRSGIAGLLLKLHLLFQERIPAVIIRAAYAPDVEVVVENDKAA